jgi:hypothetical protein
MGESEAADEPISSNRDPTGAKWRTIVANLCQAKVAIAVKSIGAAHRIYSVHQPGSHPSPPRIEPDVLSSTTVRSERPDLVLRPDSCGTSDIRVAIYLIKRASKT